MYTEKRITVPQGPSVCPVCGAETNITEEILDGYGGGYYPWKCPQCGAAGKEDFEIRKDFLGHSDVVNAAGEPVEIEDIHDEPSASREDSVQMVSELLLKGCFVSLCNPVHYSFSPGQAREIAAYLVDNGVGIITETVK